MTSSKDSKINNNFNYENDFMWVVDHLMITRYNWSLIVMALVWNWLSTGTYWSNNFDMTSTVQNQIFLTSLVSVIIGAVTNKDNSNYLMQVGVVSIILSTFSIVISKSAITSNFGPIFLLCSQFCFCILLKNIYMISFVLISLDKKYELKRTTNKKGS
jgi:hypothetical protein